MLKLLVCNSIEGEHNNFKQVNSQLSAFLAENNHLMTGTATTGTFITKLKQVMERELSPG